MRDERTPRRILSENLNALYKSGRWPKLDTIRKIADASGGKLSNGKVGRIAAASHTTDIDALGDLAAVFGVKPWQLLVPDLDPQALPVLADQGFLTDIRELVSAQQEPAAAAKQSGTRLPAGAHVEPARTAKRRKA